MYSYEKDAWGKGLLLCGIDEAGRGPLAGPVCAAAVILDPAVHIEGIYDSKKLSEKKRELLYSEITEKALYWSAAFAGEREIDELNILKATFLAMKRAYVGLGTVPDEVIVDGNRDPGLGRNVMCLVKGDAKCASVAAASIIAKVTRDRYMKNLALQYPGYGFEVHKGYPTKAHIETLRVLGPSEVHRRSFLKKILDNGK